MNGFSLSVNNKKIREDHCHSQTFVFHTRIRNPEVNTVFVQGVTEEKKDIHSYMYIYMYCVYIYIYILIYIYTHIYIYICIYIQVLHTVQFKYAHLYVTLHAKFGCVILSKKGGKKKKKL